MSSANSNVAILPNPLGYSSSTTNTSQNNNTVAVNAPQQLTQQAGQNNQNSSFSKGEPADEYDKNGARPNGQLSTSSPAGIAAAAAVTPDKLAKLLLTQGPLAIRHLTSHLATQIPGFAQLSLSKQRRLIIAALDSGDPVTGCVFEKVGWGQWAARHVGSQHVKHMQAKINAAQNGTTGSSSRRNSSSGEANEHFEKSPTRNGNGAGAGATTTVGVANANGNSNGSGSVTPVSIPATAAAAAVASSKSRSPPVRKPSESFGWKNRRESITNANNDPHRDVIPRSPRLSGTANNASAVVTRSKLIHSVNNNEDAILSSSDEEDADGDDDDEEENYSDDEEDGLNNRFQFHENKPKIPTAVIQPRSHSQVVYPSTPLLSGANVPAMRHHRSSFNNSTKGISKPKVRSRLGSFNNSSNSTNAAANANLVDGYEPVDNLQEDLGSYRRRQSFNESFMRKSSSSPKRMSISNITNATNATPLSYPNPSTASHSNANANYLAARNSNSTSPSYHSDTDEEDWASMGAASLRHDSTSTSRPSISDNEIKIKRKNLDFREEAAAYALVNLSSA